MSDVQERIVAVAISHNWLTFTSAAPARHSEVYRRMGRCGIEPSPNHIQGFLTSAGRFVTRQEAMTIAKAAGQLRWNSDDDTLISEDLW